MHSIENNLVCTQVREDTEKSLAEAARTREAPYFVCRSQRLRHVVAGRYTCCEAPGCFFIVATDSVSVFGVLSLDSHLLLNYFVLQTTYVSTSLQSPSVLLVPTILKFTLTKCFLTAQLTSVSSPYTRWSRPSRRRGISSASSSSSPLSMSATSRPLTVYTGILRFLAAMMLTLRTRLFALPPLSAARAPRTSTSTAYARLHSHTHGVLGFGSLRVCESDSVTK